MSILLKFLLLTIVNVYCFCFKQILFNILKFFFRLEHYRDESLNHNPLSTVSMSFMRERPDHGPPPPLKKPKLLHPISPQQPLKIEIAVSILLWLLCSNFVHKFFMILLKYFCF